jgi:hypothetical protein
MSFNTIFSTQSSRPTVLPKITFEELKNNISTHSYVESIDLHSPQEVYIQRRFSTETTQLILETCKKLGASLEQGQVFLTTHDSSRRNYYQSNDLIKNPGFYLTFPNHYHIGSLDFSQFTILDAAMVRYSGSGSYNYSEPTTRKWVLKVLFQGEEFSVFCDTTLIVKFGDFALKANEGITIGSVKLPMAPIEVFNYVVDASHYLNDNRRNTLDYTLISCLKGTGLVNKTELCEMMKAVINHPNMTWIEEKRVGSGIAKTLSKSVTPYIDDLRKSYPAHYCILKSLIAESGRTSDSVKLSTIFNATFETVTGVDDLAEKIWPATWEMDNNSYSYYSNAVSSNWYQAQSSYKDQRRKVLKSQGNRAITKIMEEVESLNLDEKTYPKIYEAITSGSIPLGTFFRKSEQYFIFNDNWQLWEEMLTLSPDVTVEIAKSAAPRTTYEKDLMSYFYFVLHTLPEYLEAQTGEKWTCLPKLVDEPNELEPPKEEGGISRKRSALTPIVDNSKNTVTVPYASLAIPGRQTTYCYSLDYQVLKKGFSFKGNVVMSDVEKELNGRDDYGLMFYTLTGSEQGRGYPTFLIIFERRKKGTHVHFHRTHPSRSKDGDYNPIHNWTRVCYNWMIGNVARENIVAQQGDLAFIKMEDEGKKEFKEVVKAYDNHIFASTVHFEPNNASAKSNILGYVKATEDNTLQHHEHEWVKIPQGVYEVRQCRSWEANPRGVWSLRID